LKAFSYLEPDTLDEALELIGRYREDAKVIAGGTALVNLMKNELVQPRFVIGLLRLKNLQSMANVDGLHVGALTTLRTLETSPMVVDHAPLLVQACRLVATVRIRMTATLGGAVVHADPALDTPPALLASDARVSVQSQRGSRMIPVHQFFTDLFETVLEPDELVTGIVVPQQPKNSGTAFIKFLPGSQDDYATVSVAARIALSGDTISDVRIALGSVGTTVVRAQKAEAALENKALDAENVSGAAELAAAGLEPLADIRGSVDYKRKMAAVHVKRALLAAAAAART
jgi:carbon-monoxide dehydrogenase medium subunit